MVVARVMLTSVTAPGPRPGAAGMMTERKPSVRPRSSCAARFDRSSIKMR